MLIKKTTQVLFELRDLMDSLATEEYSTPLEVLNNATIGQHVRHILEFYECLVQSRATGIINYDNRRRDLSIETNPATAKEVLNRILEQIGQENMDLTLQQQYSGQIHDLVELPTNFYREIMYNIEHAVHHQAIIRIGVQSLRPEMNLPQAFGVADSTIQFRNQNYSHSN